MDITDVFWNGGSLTHPDELWATDPATQERIQAFLTKRAAEDELCRIAREARQLLLWACGHQIRVDGVKPPSPESPLDSPGLNVCVQSLHADKTFVGSNFLQIQCVYHRLARRSFRLWKRWDLELGPLIRWSSKFLPGREALDDELMRKWNHLVLHASDYQALVREEPELQAEEGDDEDVVFNEDDE